MKHSETATTARRSAALKDQVISKRQLAGQNGRLLQQDVAVAAVPDCQHTVDGGEIAYRLKLHE